MKASSWKAMKAMKAIQAKKAKAAASRPPQYGKQFKRDASLLSSDPFMYSYLLVADQVKAGSEARVPAGCSAWVGGSLDKFKRTATRRLLPWPPRRGSWKGSAARRQPMKAMKSKNAIQAKKALRHDQLAATLTRMILEAIKPAVQDALARFRRNYRKGKLHQ